MSRIPTPLEGSPKPSGPLLIIEDNALLLRSMCRLLEGRGYPTLGVASGEEALEVSAGLGTAPTLVLVDLHLDGIDGIETIYRLRETWPGLPALLSTGGLLATKPAACALLRKPWTVKALLEAVELAFKSG